MIHEAYMPVYRCQDFLARSGVRTGSPEAVQEALADLKKCLSSIPPREGKRGDT